MPHKASSTDKAALNRMVLGVRSALGILGANADNLRAANRDGFQVLAQKLADEQDRHLGTVCALAERAIQKAIDAYGINAGYATSISFRSEGVRPGLAIFAPSNTCNQQGVVHIAANSFMFSPGWLGSTIGHEVEVHAQRHTGSHWDKTPQVDAAHEAEAYQWELDHADTFELTGAEKEILRRSLAAELKKMKA